MSDQEILFYAGGNMFGEYLTESNGENAVIHRITSCVTVNDAVNVMLASGVIDLVAGENTCYVIHNGRKERTRITGTGSLMSFII